MAGGVKRNVTVHWFRHGLRLHDNPALHEALKESEEFYAVFIFDGESAGTKNVGFNRMRFLIESLKDIDRQLRAVGGRLYVFHNNPVSVFKGLHEELGLYKLCFEQDCEPIWRPRDNAVKKFCEEHGIICVEKVSHTLWDPNVVIKTNGGTPPLTYQMFLHTVGVIGPPPRPVDDIDWTGVTFGKLSDYLSTELKVVDSVPTPEKFGVFPEMGSGEQMIRWIGGETRALEHLKERLYVEEAAFRDGYYLPNQSKPDLLGPPTSQSAALRFGCLSVRKFYWSIHDLFHSVYNGNLPLNQKITGQLIWREYFYTMSVNNEFYGEMANNPICLNIPWKDGSEKGHLERWQEGETGYPFIDAAMRQLKLEGWIHHVARNAVACFLTRGDLWISWEAGLQHFLKYLLDADWSVCAGNWMWVSSSAFEQLLDCSHCVCPVNYGRRLDPWGEYIKRYVPELQNYPVEYLYEPWKAPLEVQERAGCVIGKHYPERIVDHQDVSRRNKQYMQQVRDMLMKAPPHCCPSNEEETRQFMWLPESCMEHVLHA
ncbi:cryptochrome-1 [Schistocerca serialis cubense]|uniref:cryptochrome-1 n=1 Tax=Schistocerca serialis cubense TaxID=2023355 RepID=UPI00214E27BF|nr:cryptochrome-1 [Schistocerca serialis cubense]XP_049951181.1 cryptochrome-1 [Schistocerca serialis cubense]XP_049951182.1 cryptochrome-1 [Schistocerca serialis cubense]XP_049951183.1 cryptochrome-1 [Schistocerca serialis cubense]